MEQIEYIVLISVLTSMVLSAVSLVMMFRFMEKECKNNKKKK